MSEEVTPVGKEKDQNRRFRLFQIILGLLAVGLLYWVGIRLFYFFGSPHYLGMCFLGILFFTGVIRFRQDRRALVGFWILWGVWELIATFASIVGDGRSPIRILPSTGN